ncbi:MAG: PTS sugar transporter subunit IIA, partial [Pirellulaceae bacterium]|nr:PTS sugar transporter subunit IIA [Pirellulaceae bacterium]
MKFADFVEPAAICPQLKAGDKESVIYELVQSLVDAGQIEENEKEGIVRAVLKREELGSTGIGRGVAIPHTKHPSVEKLVGTVGVSVEGVDFN